MGLNYKYLELSKTFSPWLPEKDCTNKDTKERKAGNIQPGKVLCYSSFEIIKGNTISSRNTENYEKPYKDQRCKCNYRIAFDISKIWYFKLKPHAFILKTNQIRIKVAEFL